MKYFLLKFQRIKLYTFYEILRYVYDRLYIKIYRILNHDEYGDLLIEDLKGSESKKYGFDQFVSQFKSKSCLGFR